VDGSAELGTFADDQTRSLEVADHHRLGGDLDLVDRLGVAAVAPADGRVARLDLGGRARWALEREVMLRQRDAGVDLALDHHIFLAPHHTLDADPLADDDRVLSVAVPVAGHMPSSAQAAACWHLPRRPTNAMFLCRASCGHSRAT